MRFHCVIISLESRILPESRRGARRDGFGRARRDAMRFHCVIISLESRILPESRRGARRDGFGRARRDAMRFHCVIISFESRILPESRRGARRDTFGRNKIRWNGAEMRAVPFLKSSVPSCLRALRVDRPEAWAAPTASRAGPPDGRARPSRIAPARSKIATRHLKPRSGDLTT